MIFTLRSNNTHVKYQFTVQRISEFKKAIEDVLCAVSQTNKDKFLELIKNRASVESKEKFLTEIFDNINLASNNFRLTFSFDTDDTEAKFCDYFEEIRKNYAEILQDMFWASKQSVMTDEYDVPLKADFMRLANEYKDQQSSFNSGNHRVWIVAASVNEDDNYIDNVCEKLSSFNFEYILYKAALDFLKYENNKAHQIIS